jgi:hopanoid biosynthesis associated protein HpnK
VRRLIVNADDFGRSESINEAVITAHRDGILTSASLMVNEAASADAVRLAKANPKLGVGLHLTLVCGHSALPSEKIPELVDEDRVFRRGPVSSGFRFFFDPRLRSWLRAEIHEQFRRFQDTGLALDHVNGHLHMHLHPVVFRILMQDAELLGIRRLRLTRDPFRLNLRLAKGRWFYRASHAAIFRFLSVRARAELESRGIWYAARVFGLLQDSRVDEEFVLRLLNALPSGDSELYSHPSLGEAAHEFSALTSPRVRKLAADLGLNLIRYQDL